MDHNEANRRAQELLEPVNQALLNCDDRNDLLILCFAMMNRSKEILDRELGQLRRKNLFSEFSE